jgi:hypothetical protein
MNSQEQIDFLKNQLEKTAEWLSLLVVKQGQELAKPKSKRGLRDSRSSYGLDSLGNIFQYFDGDLGVSNDNAFINQESAQLQAQRNTLVYRMRVAALESPVDWSNLRKKYYPVWDYSKLPEVFFQHSNFIKASQLPHFACDEKLRMFMKPLSTDEQKLLICGVE